VKGLANPPHAAMHEGAFVSGFGSGGNYNVHDFSTKLNNWIALGTDLPVVALNFGNSSGISGSGISKMDTATTHNGSGEITGWEALWFSISGFLMGMNADRTNGYMNWTSWHYSEYYWLDEFDPAFIHLGDPVGAYTTQSGVYFREYTDGWAVANPTANHITGLSVPNGSSARVINHGNFKNASSAALVTSFNLNSHHGVILLKSDKSITNSDNPTGSSNPTSPFSQSDRIQTNTGGSTVNVRSCASTSCSILGTQPDRSLGTITSASPTTADGYTWHNIDFISGVDGYVAEDLLVFAGDLNRDAVVNSLDWSTMNNGWFTNDSVADINRDSIVNSIDFGILNRNWGRSI
jgi:hypothetical protein